VVPAVYELIGIEHLNYSVEEEGGKVWEEEETEEEEVKAMMTTTRIMLAQELYFSIMCMSFVCVHSVLVVCVRASLFCCMV